MSPISISTYVSTATTTRILDAIKNNQDAVEAAKSYDKNPLFKFIDTILLELGCDPSHCYYTVQDEAKIAYAKQLMNAVRETNLTQRGNTTYSAEITLQNGEENSIGKFKLVDYQDSQGKHTITLIKIADKERDCTPIGCSYDNFSFADIRQYDYSLFSCNKLTQVFQELSGDTQFDLITLVSKTDDNGIVTLPLKNGSTHYYRLEEAEGGVRISTVANPDVGIHSQPENSVQITHIDDLTMSDIGNHYDNLCSRDHLIF